ncbi:MAG: hypothetical protein LBL21_01345 [Rickettsiales bacterium]|jgi:hypothetical protein|nr:hypothetical protein [Rickettsiales bacterium]
MKKLLCFLYLTTFAINDSPAVSAAELLSMPGDIVIGETFCEITAYASELEELASRVVNNGSISLLIFNYDGSMRVLPRFDGLVFPVLMDDADPMFNYEVDPDRRTVHAARETDYAVIFGRGDERAAFLNSIRRAGAGGKILENLDAAQSMSGLSGEMDRTMFFNPLVLNNDLLRMITRIGFYDYEKLGFFGGSRYEMDGASVGNKFLFGYSSDGFSVSSGFYAGKADEDDKYKKGRAFVYGADLSARYGWLGAGVKTLAADWKNIALMEPGGGVRTEATSRLFYAFLDLAPDFENFRPIVRLNYAESEIAGRSDSRLYLSYGAHAYVLDRHVGVSGKYGLYAARNLNETDVGLTAGWHFAEDGIVVEAKLGLRNLSVEIMAGF